MIIRIRVSYFVVDSEVFENISGLNMFEDGIVLGGVGGSFGWEEGFLSCLFFVGGMFVVLVLDIDFFKCVFYCCSVFV